MKQILVILLLALVVPRVALKAEKPGKKPRVAVLEFINLSDNQGLDFLKKALAENVATTVGKDKRVINIERLQFSKILREIELQQSGLFEGDEMQIDGSKIKADYLLVGSFSGSSEKISVNLRAVKVSSSKIITSQQSSAPIDTIFTQLPLAARALVHRMVSKKIGYLTVQSNPNGAEIFVNGQKIGESPVLNYDLPEGAYSLKLIMPRRKSYESTVTITANTEEQVNALLPTLKFQDRFFIEANAGFFSPQKNGIDDNAFSFGLAFGRTYGWFLFQLETNIITNMNRKSSYQVPFSSREETRKISLFSIAMHTRYILFDFSQYINLFIGANLGYLRLSEKELYEFAHGDTSKGYNLFQLAPALGFNFFNYSAFNLFIEGRYIFAFPKITRENIENVTFLGTANLSEESYSLRGLQVSMGVRYGF